MRPCPMSWNLCMISRTGMCKFRKSPSKKRSSCAIRTHRHRKGLWRIPTLDQWVAGAGVWNPRAISDRAKRVHGSMCSLTKTRTVRVSAPQSIQEPVSGDLLIEPSAHKAHCQASVRHTRKHCLLLHFHRRLLQLGSSQSQRSGGAMSAAPR